MLVFEKELKIRPAEYSKCFVLLSCLGSQTSAIVLPQVVE
jgi:hypothetical protein